MDNSHIPENYEPIYQFIRAEIIALSKLSVERLNSASYELEMKHGYFFHEYAGPIISDHFIAFQTMLKELKVPFSYKADSALNGLSLPEYYLAWAWQANKCAKYYVDDDGEIFGLPKPSEGKTTIESAREGLNAVKLAQRCISHARALMGKGLIGPNTHGAS